MRFKSNIRKILLLSLGVVMGSGLLVLLIAAINKKNHKTCTGVTISINGKTADAVFLNRQEVMNVIAPDKNDPPRGKPMAAFDLKKIETALGRNVWIKNVQLFFDNNGVLRVTVEERAPVARVFTISGNSFYIDSSGKRLPLNSRMVVKLPVYSNFPVDNELLSGQDSVLMQQIKQMSPFILNDPFWMAQIAQVDITPYRTFEMVPVVGKHVIAFGDGSGYEQKFHRLFLFYQQVGAKIGLDKYSIINVQFDKQVVATKKGSTSKIDSLQAIKNIEKMIEASKQLPNDTVSTTVDNIIAPTPNHPPPLKNQAVLPPHKSKPKAVMKKPGG